MDVIRTRAGQRPGASVSGTLKRLFDRRSLLCLLGMSFACLQQPVFADTSDWQRMKVAGETALAVNNYGGAEKELSGALREAEKFAAGDARMADTLRSLAGLYCIRGQFNRAEPLYERELRVREKAFGGEHPEVVACVGKLAQFYLNHGAPAKGDKLASLLLGFAERKVKEQQNIKGNFAKLEQFYGKSKDYAEARALLQRLEQNTEKTTATQDLELATTLDSLGHLYQAKKRFDLAEKMYRHALAFREPNLQPGHLALALSYENLAALYSAQGKNAQAEPLYKQALAVTEKTLQPERPEVYSRLDELARTYVSMGQTIEAVSLYRRALTILEKTRPGAADTGKASYALAQLYIKEGKFPEAEPLVKRALAISESVHGPEHAAVAPILDTYADVLQRVNKSSEAARMRARARAIKGVSLVSKGDSGSDF
jgi:tetratricopeptide (TPR) repeat protein